MAGLTTLFKARLTSQGLEALTAAFNRNIVTHHEQRVTPSSRWPAYWLNPDLCRQPHHPPFIILRRHLQVIDGDPCFLHVARGITNSGCPAIYLNLYPFQKEDFDPCVDAFIISGATHNTGGSQEFSTEPLTNPTFIVPDPYFEDHRIYTGGTGHKQPLWIYFFLEGQGKVRVHAFYCSMRGAIKKELDIIIESPGLYVYGDYGRF